MLAGRGARLVLACRDAERATGAAHRIRTETPDAMLEVLQLDLASLASTREAAADLRSRHERLDLLVFHAGVMNVPFALTRNGFERHLGINHLGHFALTGLLLELLLATPGSRVVSVSSNAHRRHGDLDLGDLHWRRRRYRSMRAYGQSKLANLLFTYELQRRLAKGGAPTIAVAAHPGTARTHLMRDSSFLTRAAISPRLRWLTSPFVQDARMGALPVLRAATDTDVRGGEYYGPARPAGLTGFPIRVESSQRSHDAGLQRRLWEESERLTGVTYQPVA